MSQTLSPFKVKYDINLDSSYKGDLDNARANGKGTYTSSIGTYVGDFKEGNFHGNGTLTVKGGVYQGTWVKGILESGKFIYEDKLEHKSIDEDEWIYCSKKDPRFYIEIKNGLKIGDPLEYDTPHVTKPHIPDGCYDVIEGYYDPNKFAIFDYENHTQIRMPSKLESEWIIKNCRIGQ